MIDDAGKYKTFAVSTPADLIEKLAWEIRQLESHDEADCQGATYKALNCAVTAWHMADWVFESCDRPRLDYLSTLAGRRISKKVDLQNWCRASEAAVGMCQQIATATKHAFVKDYPDAMLHALPQLEVRHGVDGGDVWLRLVISRGRDTYAPVEIFWRAEAFWRRLLEQLRLTYENENRHT